MSFALLLQGKGALEPNHEATQLSDICYTRVIRFTQHVVVLKNCATNHHQ